MSPTTSSTPGGSGQALSGSVVPDARAAIAMMRSFGPATAAALSYEILDLFDHARRSTLKNNAMPNKRGGQKLLANAIHRWTSGAKGADPAIKDTKGEMFAAMPGSEEFGKDYFKMLEEGGKVSATSPMVVPFGAGLRRSAVPGSLRGNARFNQLLANKGLVQPAPGVRYLVAKDGKSADKRTQVFGFLIRGRKQRPLMNMRATFNRVLPGHAAKMQKVIDRALAGVAGTDLLSEAKAKFTARKAAEAAAMAARLSAADAKKAQKKAVTVSKKVAKSNRTKGD